jgi:hypothetical protein
MEMEPGNSPRHLLKQTYNKKHRFRLHNQQNSKHKPCLELSVKRRAELGVMSMQNGLIQTRHSNSEMSLVLALSVQQLLGLDLSVPDMELRLFWMRCEG